MALERARLTEPAYVAATTATSVYANPSGKKTFLKGAKIFNSNTSAETVKIYLVPDNAGAAGTMAAVNQVGEISVPAKETADFSFSVDNYPYVMSDTNDTVQMSTTTASKVTVYLLGDRE